MAVQISGNDITVPRDGSFTRNVTIGGTLTYEDVTNIDSVGLVTARTGIEIGARPGVAASISVDGNMIVSGISTFGGALSGTTGTFSGAVSGTTGTFSGAVSGTTGTFTGNVDINGNELILDADADTSITADTDDQIDVKLSGSDRMSIKASGSTSVDLNTGGSMKLTVGDSDSHQFINGSDEAMRIDSSGTLLLGATSYGGGGNDPIVYVRTASANAVKIHKTGSGASTLQLTCASGTGTGEGTSAGLQLAQEGTSSYIANNDDGNMYLSMNGVSTILHRANGTLRQRQASGGTNTATYNENTAWTSFSANNASNYDYKFINQRSSPGANYSIEITAAADVDNTTYRHLNVTKNSNSSGIFVIFGNGNVQNANNSYGQTSDVKLKENIVDANSQWDDIKGLRVRNFNFKSDSGYSTHKQIGLIAQEAETVSAGLVENVNDVTEDANGTKTETGEVTKQLKYSVLYMKAIKCLQEAQTRIETLESEVAALKSN